MEFRTGRLCDCNRGNEMTVCQKYQSQCEKHMKIGGN